MSVKKIFYDNMNEYANIKKELGYFQNNYDSVSNNIFEILKTKLKFQSEHFRKHGYHVSSERDAEKIELCIRLIDKVQNEYYLDEQLMKKDPIADKDIENAIRKHDKAKKLLFNILENNIESWWD
jgi:hypothetical protein